MTTRRIPFAEERWGGGGAMQVVAEVLAAAVVALAAAAFTWFGLDLQSREPAAERSVRKLTTSDASATPVPVRPHPGASIAC